jgi:Tfp pilus assembly PilM family ATPase
MSKLDDLVEQLAFGTEPGKGATCLGLYLAPDVVYLSETHVAGGKLVVDHMVRIPIPSDGKGPGATATMNTDFLADPAKIAGLIRQSMSQLRWNSKNVRVTLSHHLGLLRYFAMPAMERRFLRSAVPLEAKKYIPIPFDLLAHDYAAAPLPSESGGKARVGVLIAVTQKKNIENVMGLLAQLKLNLIGLEVAPVSVLRMWQAAEPPKDGSAYAHVHIDGGSVRIVVIDRGVPVFFREVFLGEDATVGDMRKIDLSGCLSFVQKQLGLSGVSRLDVSGSLASLPALAEAFAAETGLKAAIQDTPKLLGVKTGDWGGYASLGASVQPPLNAPSPLNLAAIGRVTDEERQTARDILILGAVFAVFFVVMGVVKMVTYSYHAQELHKYEKLLPPDIALSLAGLAPAQIDNQLKDMQAQLTQLRAVINGSRHLNVSTVLKEIIDAMPEKLWIDHLNIANDLVNSDKPFDVVLGGHVQDKSVADEQALAFNFKEALIKNPLLGKSFEISISVQKAGDTEVMQAAQDSKALAAMLEKRTQFQLELRAKK